MFGSFSSNTALEVLEVLKRLGLRTGSEPGARDEPLVAFALAIADLEALDLEDDVDWGVLNGRPDIPSEIWKHRIDFSFACFENAPAWHAATLSFGALAFLCSLRMVGPPKDFRGIVLSSFYTRKRCKHPTIEGDGISSYAGASLDDDGGIGRKLFNVKSAVIAFGTASDGKSEELVECGGYQKEARKRGWPQLPTSDSMSLYLNRNFAHRPAYRDVLIEQHPTFADKPALLSIKGEHYFRAKFAPQERSRLLVPFERPIEGVLLQKLLSVPNSFQRLGEQIEVNVLGASGTDAACFRPTQVGYLPTGSAPGFFGVLGPAKLFDVIPLAEKIVAEAPSRPRMQQAIRPFNAVPDAMKTSLRGVRLASLIADAYPELVNRENNLSPLSLRRCPFADQHGSKRGQSDGSLYCYDPDHTPYPVMRCFHQNTCGARRTEEFVEAMIEQGDLDRDTVYDNAAYRDEYESERGPPLPNEPLLGWRQRLNGKE